MTKEKLDLLKHNIKIIVDTLLKLWNNDIKSTSKRKDYDRTKSQSIKRLGRNYRHY